MTTLLAASYPPTANDRFKEAFGTRVWLSLILATLIHVLPFRFFPDIEVEDWGRGATQVAEVVRFSPPPLPDAPTAVRRPAAPRISANVDASETLPTLSWAAAAVLPPPPPAPAAEGVRDGIAFVPYTVAPSLRNPDVVERVLQREYPPTLRDAGMGGMVRLLVHIDSSGRMTEARVGEGSGYASLDAAALRVAETMRFRPAMNRDVPVAVWIELPVTFRVR